MDYASLALGLTLLVIGASYFVEYAISIAKHMRLPLVVFGAVIVAIGTSLPELVVTIEAALKNSPDIIVGNILGSNIANVGLVLAVAMLMGRTSIRQKRLGGKNRLLLILTLVFLCLLQLRLLFWPAGFALLALAGFLIFGLTKDRTHQQEINKLNTKNLALSWIVLIASLAGVIIGSQVVVNASLAIAQAWQVSAGIIAATIIAVGTSLPELVITIAAVKKREHGLALGNLLGSNLFNIALIGGAGAALGNLNVALSVPTIIFFLMFAGALYTVAAGMIKPTPRYGMVLIGLYAVYVVMEYSL